MRKKKNRIVVGMFWGDEGKAKLVDFLTKYADVVVRYQGGANAGHSVEVDGRRFVLHQVPTGILHPDKICVLGAGMVIDLPKLVEELQSLEDSGIDWRNRVRISPRAHIVLPYHKVIESIMEEQEKIGTTKRGIGPAYRDRAGRIGLRAGDLLLGKNHIIKLLDRWLDIAGKLYEKTFDAEFQSPSDVASVLESSADFLDRAIIDSTKFLDDTARNSGGVLAEGAQGTMLSLNWGTYPFVTSSETTAGGAAEGIGIDLRLFDEIIGIAKAFCTRVGNGPFPTEGDENLQKLLRGTGEHSYDEFGSTTGRPRRCGWLDGVVLEYSTRINGIDAIALTKLDILSKIRPLKIATKYNNFSAIPSTAEEMSIAEPIYEEFSGWDDDISKIREYDKLPDGAKEYISAVEKISKKPVKYIGVGPSRDDLIVKE
ncbi:adenylosuccinate synthase [bacterium]|nr:MAG: adenylosuccinate synthase [bacterium]